MAPEGINEIFAQTSEKIYCVSNVTGNEKIESNKFTNKLTEILDRSRNTKNFQRTLNNFHSCCKTNFKTIH